MKKFVIILLAACLLLGCGVGYVAAKDPARGSGEPVTLYDPENAAAPAGTETAAPAAENAAEGSGESEQPVFRGLDYAAIRALHDPDEIVGEVDGRSVSWEEYFYWLHSVGVDAENYIQTLAHYGQSLDWNDKLSADSEETLAEYVVHLTNDYVRQLNVIETLAEENGVTLTPENEAALAEDLQATIAEACGEGAGEAEFNALLEENDISREMYERVKRSNYLYANLLPAIFGENGSKISEEDAIGYLRENDYLSAAHILFLTMDMDTREALDEATIAEKKALAETVAEELRSIEDAAERAARFAELKEQYCEDDDGAKAFPDGYLFLPGDMVPEFENGIRTLQDFEVSEPVLSGYGYHVIMRLPLSADMTVFNTDGDARALCADAQFNKLLNQRIEASVFTPCVDPIDLTGYLLGD